MADFFINVTDAAIAGEVRLKNNETWTKDTALRCVALDHSIIDFFYYSYIRAGPDRRYSSKNMTWPQFMREKIQRPGTTFSNFSDGVVVLKGHQNYFCRFATL